MTSQQIIQNKDIVLREGWFKKRNFKGEIGRAYSRRWVVLTNRYFEWYDFPNGVRKNTIPLDHCYSRIHEGTGLIVGTYQSTTGLQTAVGLQHSKEWLLRDEGPTPAATANEWHEAITNAVENYRNVGGSSAASGNKGLVSITDVLKPVGQPTSVTQSVSPGIGTPAASTTTTMYNSPSPYGGAPSPAVVQQQNYGYGGTTQTTTTTSYGGGYAQPAYVPPVQQTYVAPTATYVAPAPYALPMATYVAQPQMMYAPQPAFVQPTMTFVQPQVVVQPPVYTTFNPMY